ncbi:MAG: radical SAM protein [Thermodesulfobacteriota bacterium]
MTAGSRNHLLPVRLADGLLVEAVFYGTGTLCLSTQAGCAMGCPFCAAGRGGFARNLSQEELAAQVSAARQRGYEPARLTLSGMGEPLANPAAVIPFLVEQHRQGLPVSLTTTGRPLSQLAAFLRLPHNGLMLSMHSADAVTHRRLVPAGPDFAALWDLLAACWPLLSRRQRRRLGASYLLLAGVNDRDQDLVALKDRLQPFRELTVHLLLPNPVPASPFRPSPASVVAHWHQALRGRGIHVRRANCWRRERTGGCGTLFLRERPAAVLEKAQEGQDQPSSATDTRAQVESLPRHPPAPG